jgi:hypothetical protein
MKRGLRHPIMSTTVLTSDANFLDTLKDLVPYIKSELNCGEVIFDTNVD